MVRLVGWRGLGISTTEEARVQAAIDRHMRRISVMTGDLIDVNMRVKQASKLGKTHRYELNLALITNDETYYAATTVWDLLEAVHKAFTSVEKQIQTRMGRVRERYYAKEFVEEQVVRS